LCSLGHVASPSEQQAKVQQNRMQAEQLIQTFGGGPANVATNNSHMGLPTTLSGWADLGVEAGTLFSKFKKSTTPRHNVGHYH